MRLLDHVYLVGSGNLGFDLTDPFDCHIYLIDGGAELALIDAGCGVSAEAVLENVRQDGFDPSGIRHLIFTHGHADHSAGAAPMRRLLGHLTTYLSTATADFLRTGDEKGLSVDVARAAGRYPADYPFEPCEVDVELGDGDTLTVGRLALDVFDTPGHCDGHACFLLKDRDQRILFSGDHIFYGGRVLLQNMYDCRLDALVRSIRRLRDVGVTALLPGHLTLTLHDGQRHIDRSNQLLDQLRIPEPLPVAW